MEEIDIAVVGAGPAGLRAAEVVAGMGRKVTVFEGKPSVGRKFLVAGRGGLNITHGEPFETFITRYEGGSHWEEILREFDADALRDWCHGLGIETFQATSGRVYPKVLKGASILRAWLARLKTLAVEIRPGCLWKELLPGNILCFQDQDQVRAKAVIFALGGGSWPRTGSDGGWLEKFQEMGIGCAPLQSSNCGWECEWPPQILAEAEGLPIKNLRLNVGRASVLGELLITRYGLEGGAIYALGSKLRAMKEPAVTIDFKPTFSEAELLEKLRGIEGNLLEGATRRWTLSVPARAVLSRKNYPSAESLAAEVKSCRIALLRPRPLAEAISSAGGVLWNELNEQLMLLKHPGIFICGEMIDWDAPTGGYLLQGAFATGSRAGKGAVAFSG
ncbi:MAG: TIGR03862 family flavoprotein [Armatimonadetes bacterium]|nr:TIGR03862 family flavoprotein [Akkermansiaceae bacterium]